MEFGGHNTKSMGSDSNTATSGVYDLGLKAPACDLARLSEQGIGLWAALNSPRLVVSFLSPNGRRSNGFEQGRGGLV